jgi:UDP-glucose 4-epimerase
MTQETVLVLGGSGFLGSHVADALTDAGYRTRIFDQRASAYCNRDQEMIIGDVMDADAVVRAASDCSCVYNFAGIADIDDAKQRPLETAQVNVIGNIHALEAARLAGARRFILASTVYVYSEAGSFYRASKQSAERFVETYHERFGLPYTVVRYGSLYGRRAREHNGIFRYLSQALREKRIDYAGSEEAMREYIHVSDAAKLSVQILDERYANRHMILTGHERLAVKNLMRMICEMLPASVDVRYGNRHDEGHYVMTPYAYHPRVGHKLVATDYVDLGQGLLDCLAAINEQAPETTTIAGNTASPAARKK